MELFSCGRESSDAFCVLCVGLLTHRFTSPRHESRGALYRYYTLSKCCLYWNSVHVCIECRTLRECIPRVRMEAIGSVSLSCSLKIGSHLFHSSLCDETFPRYVTWCIFCFASMWNSKHTYQWTDTEKNEIRHTVIMSTFNVIFYWTF
jgi:hypothetical protein